jgi:hypothetical protein
MVKGTGMVPTHQGWSQKCLGWKSYRHEDFAWILVENAQNIGIEAEMNIRQFKQDKEGVIH